MLPRRSEDRVIAGVCAGLAEEIGIEPMVFRTFYTMTLVLFGLGLPLYIALYIAMEPRTSEAGSTHASGRAV